MGRRSAHYYRRFSGWGLATFFALRTFIMDSLLRICTVSTQHFGDSLRRLHFGMKVEVTIKIGCNIKCWMSEPLLDRLHGYSVCKQQTGTWMTKIMESNVFELIFLNDVLEVRSHKVWRDQLRICQRVILTLFSHQWYEPLYISTEDFAKSGRFFPCFFLQKEKISVLHIFLYSFSCKMIYSLSFCFAILIR